MINNCSKKARETTAKLLNVDKEVINVYIQGAVHGYCNNNAGKHFSARLLFGGDNTIWYNTPLEKIYDYHILALKGDSKKAIEKAGIDVGLLLKNVLINDKFTYAQVDGYTNEYYKCD